MIEDGMAMQHIARLGPMDEIVERAQPTMGGVVIVMNAVGRRMGDEKIQRALMTQTADKNPWHEMVDAHEHFALGILIRPPRRVKDTASQAGHQQTVCIN